MANTRTKTNATSADNGFFVSQNAKEKAKKDLKDLSWQELLDFKQRQEKLLRHKLSLKQLPDKGEKVVKSHEEILAEIERRTKDVNDATKMFSTLKIAEKANESLSKLEWQGNKNGISNSAQKPAVDSDDEDENENDILRVIVNNSASTSSARITRILPPEPELITGEDLEQIKSFARTASKENLNGETAIDAEIVAIDTDKKLPNIKSNLKEFKEHKICDELQKETQNDNQKMDQHTTYLVEKTEIQANPLREKFKPHKSVKSKVNDPEKKVAPKSKTWEVTAATPPSMKHNGTKMLSLLESVALLENYNKNVKVLQEEEAIKRLSNKEERLRNSNILLPDTGTLKNHKSFNTFRSHEADVEDTIISVDSDQDEE